MHAPHEYCTHTNKTQSSVWTQHYCSALAMLAAEPANMAPMGEQGVFVEVQASMREHPRHDELQICACRYVSTRGLVTARAAGDRCVE